MTTTDLPNALLSRLQEQGVELAVVIGPTDKDDPCLDWVGAVVSVSGRTAGVPSFADALRDGLFHPGCRHTLVAFNPATVSRRRLDEAKFCTQHAMAAMQARARGQQPPFLAARRHLQEEIQRRTTGTAAGVTPRAKFERVYESARKAEAAGDLSTALLKIRAALDLLREHDLFGSSQARLMETLESHARRLQSLPKAS